ncbi:MAG TPA: sulfotransferase, partial [Kiritimatiellia bacterium]
MRLFCFALFGLFNGLCLLLDEILFPGYRRAKIEAPVFILGNPRSGTTYLHRTLSRDEGRFFVFKTWEILFPSVLQKKLGSLLGAIDRAVGSPMFRLVTYVERRLLGKFRDLHPTGLFHAEEDEMLFLHAFASLYLVFLFPLPSAFLPFADFDHNVPEPRRKRLMAFYTSCLKRQAYARGRGKTFLSKNPFFSGKMASLHATFPDARFIYLIRNPLEAIPSTISEGYATCVYAPRNSAPSQEFQSLVYDVAKVFYRRPLAYAAAHPECMCPILRFTDVTARPLDTIAGLYQQLGLPMTDGFRGLLAQEQAKAASYRSSHEYVLGQFVIPARRITEDLADVFDKFGFSRDVPVRSSAPAHFKPVPLSPAENIIHRAWEEYDGDGTGAVRWRFRGIVDVALLRAALERLQQLHPKLKVGIAVGANGGRYFDMAQTPNPIPVVVV